MKRKFKILMISLLSVVVIGLGVSFWYLSDVYDAVCVKHPNSISITYDDDNTLVMQLLDESKQNGGAVVFYQGGKVDEKSYIEIMVPIVEAGYTVFMPTAPFELAVLSPNMMQKVIDRYDFKNWYAGGHSLGGSMISSFVSKNQDKVNGLFLLASYATVDLTDYKGWVVSIYGSNDLVLNMESFEENQSNLPSHAEIAIIEGGNHAQFGNYGVQDGDGVASIASSEQYSQTQNLLLSYMQSDKNE